MSVAVVDRFEVIDIAYQEGERSPETHCAGNLPRKLLLEKSSITATSELIDGGENAIAGNGRLQRSCKADQATDDADVSPKSLASGVFRDDLIRTRSQRVRRSGSAAAVDENDVRTGSHFQLARFPDQVELIRKQHRMDAFSQSVEGIPGVGNDFDLDLGIVEYLYVALPCRVRSKHHQ